MAGDAPSFSNWHESQPDAFAGFQQDCAWLDAKTGQWRALACDSGVRFDPLPWRLAELSCLCGRGSASAAFAGDREALEATRSYNQRLLTRRMVIVFAAAIAIAALPSLLLLGRAGWRRLRRGAKAEPSVRSSQGAAASSSRSATAAALSTPSGAASSTAGVKGKLHAARASAAGRRLRVSFAMGQAGWALSVVCLTPAVSKAAGQSIEAAVCDIEWGLVLFPLGLCLLLLALSPIDARAIRVVCAALVVGCTGFGALHLSTTLTGGLPYALGIPLFTVCFSAAGALAPTLRCRGDRAMQPRPALRWLWTVTRLGFLGGSVLGAGLNIADYLQGSKYGRHWAIGALSSAASLLCAALATTRNRGRIHRRLGRLGGRGTEAEDAAAVAALVGGSAPDAALERASKLLRCLPASRLLAADFDDSLTTAPPAGPTLHARTEPAAMGEVTAFLSHSWSDEREAPGAKHALVSRWATRRQEATGKEPTLWLVAISPHRCTIPSCPMHAR